VKYLSLNIWLWKIILLTNLISCQSDETVRNEISFHDNGVILEALSPCSNSNSPCDQSGLTLNRLEVVKIGKKLIIEDSVWYGFNVPGKGDLWYYGPSDKIALGTRRMGSANQEKTVYEFPDYFASVTGNINPDTEFLILDAGSYKGSSWMMIDISNNLRGWISSDQVGSYSNPK